MRKRNPIFRKKTARAARIPPERAEQVKAEALAEVNKLREIRGAAPLSELPQGVRRSSLYCPASLALAPCGVAGVGARTMAVDSGYHGNLVVPTPAPIAAFVRAFDEGAYPDLVQSTVLRQTNNIVVVSEGETEIIPLPDPEPLAA